MYLIKGKDLITCALYAVYKNGTILIMCPSMLLDECGVKSNWLIILGAVYVIECG